jgi:hypothetical protein
VSNYLQESTAVYPENTEKCKTNRIAYYWFVLIQPDLLLFSFEFICEGTLLPQTENGLGPTVNTTRTDLFNGLETEKSKKFTENGCYLMCDVAYMQHGVCASDLCQKFGYLLYNTFLYNSTACCVIPQTLWNGNMLSCDGVTVDGFWIEDRIY